MSELASVVPVTQADGTKSYLFYGAPGSGKTTLAAQHPARKKLFLDMDQKLGEIENLPGKEYIQVWSPHTPLGNPDKIDIPHSPDAKNVQMGMIPAKKPQGYEKLVNATNELLAQREHFPYDLVVLDSLTAVGDHWTHLLMYTHKVSFMTERLWGIYLAGMQDYINGFLQLPCERIVIAHEKVMTDEDTKQQRIRPSVAGQLGDNLVRFFTEGYYIKGRDRGGIYKLQTVKDSQIAARTSRNLEAEVVCGAGVFNARTI